MNSLLVAAERIKLAQGSRFKWNNVCSNNLNRVIEGHSTSIGVPKEFIFFPLLTVAASFMGINSSVRINEEWSEPSILWTIVAARKGEGKSSAAKRLTKAVQEIEKEETEEDGDAEHDTVEDKERHIPQRLVEHFSFEKLHDVMMKNNNQCLAIYDEMKTLYNQLDVYKPSNSSLDRKTLLSLNGGGAWSRSFKTSSGKMDSTCFNMCGFIQPSYVVEMLQMDDTDGFNDRQLFDCPPEIEVYYRDMKVPMERDIPTFTQILRHINNNHSSEQVYSFDEQALEEFVQYHDGLVDRKKEIKIDENRRGILSKARGQVARIAMVIHALEQAIHIAEDHLNENEDDDDTESEHTQWCTRISKASFLKAKALMNHFITQKFELMPKEVCFNADQQESPNTFRESQCCDDQSLQNFVSTDSHKIVRALTHKDTKQGKQLSASIVAQAKLQRPLKDTSTSNGNKYPVSTAVSFLKKLEGLGFGDVAERNPTGKKTSFTFRKRPFDELDDDAIDILKKIKLSKEEYNI